MRKLLAEPRRMGSWRGRRRPAYPGRCWHTVRNTSPVDNLTVAGGNFATQPSITRAGALHTGLRPCGAKHRSEPQQRFESRSSRKEDLAGNHGTEPSPGGVNGLREELARQSHRAALAWFDSDLSRWVGCPVSVNRAGSTTKPEAEGCPPAQGVFDQGSGTAAPLHVP